MDDGWAFVGTTVVVITVLAVTFAIVARCHAKRVTSIADEMQTRSLERDFRAASIDTTLDDP